MCEATIGANFFLSFQILFEFLSLNLSAYLNFDCYFEYIAKTVAKELGVSFKVRRFTSDSFIIFINLKFALVWGLVLFYLGPKMFVINGMNMLRCRDE